MAPKSLTLDVEIGELSPDGSGVAICTIGGERRAVFVSGVLPGERARVELDPKGRPARGRLLELLVASAERTTPPCEDADRCGGCDWMFVSLGAQPREHGAIVTRLLASMPIADRTHHAAVRALGYRTRARVHAMAKRGRVAVGMFARRTRDPVVVDTCAVLDPVLDRARAALPNWLEGASGRGEIALGLGYPSEERKAVLDLRWSGELPGAVFGRLEQAVNEGALAGVRIFSGDVRIPAKIGDPTPYIVGADGVPLRLAPGGFSQATEAGNTLLARRVAELARGLPAGSCVELYAGAGNLTVLLARDRDVVAVEQVEDACAAARANLEARGLDRARIVHADAGTYSIPKSTRLVVLDPPREGARDVAKSMATLAKGAHAPAILYVACDPPTLARDLRTLTEAGYAIRTLETFEMFPHTSHVETVAVLLPPGGQG